MLSDEDRAWLKALNAELWPPTDKRIKLADEWGKITREDLERALALIEPSPLVTTLYCSGMFGGVGITLFEHELYPGTRPVELLSISEQMVPRLDVRSVYEHLRGAPSRLRASENPKSAPNFGNTKIQTQNGDLMVNQEKKILVLDESDESETEMTEQPPGAPNLASKVHRVLFSAMAALTLDEIAKHADLTRDEVTDGLTDLGESVLRIPLSSSTACFILPNFVAR